MSADPNAERRLVALERVCCLDCGAAYAKPAAGGTVEENPGCPRCGYLGWIPAGGELREPRQTRSVVDLRLRPADRRR